MLKKLTGKTHVLAIAGAAVGAIILVAFAASLLLRVDASAAQAAALFAAGGGEVVGMEIDREGLWNEYTYQIHSGDTWYEVDVNAFGSVTGLENSRFPSGWD